MGKACAAIEIQKTADQVWAVIGRFDDIFWREGVQTCTVEGDIRTVTMGRPGGAIQSLKYHSDDATRTLSYGIHAYIGGDTLINLPDGRKFDLRSMIGRHRATLNVTPQGASACLVRYDVEIEDGYDALLEGTRNGYQTALHKLKRDLEG